MTPKLRIKDLNGNLLLDSTKTPSRTVGRFTAGPGYTTSDPFDSNGYHRNFPCPPGTSPFAVCLPINEQAGVALVSRVDANTAQLNYALPTFANGGAVQFIYGYAKQ